MAGFINSLGKAAGGAVADSVGGLVSQGLGAIVNTMFGNGDRRRKKLMREQIEAQKELNRYASELNYQYGEQAADNAYRRQMRMYERSYKDQSYAAMRKQMEDAGLSVGLMYGGSGSGGGAGEMSGAPQGATGGATGGDASAAMAIAIRERELENQTRMTNAQIKLTEAQAEAARAGARKSNVDADDTEQTREKRISLYEEEIEKTFEEGRAKWIENIAKQFENEIGDQEGGIVYKDEKYGEILMDTMATSFQTKRVSIKEILSAAGANEAAAALNNEKVRRYAEEVAIAWLNAKNGERMAAAQEVANRIAEEMKGFGVGENVNWKNITEAITEALPAALMLISLTPWGKAAKAGKTGIGLLRRGYSMLKNAMK